MRHVFASLPISAGAIGMGKAPRPGALVAPSGCPQAGHGAPHGRRQNRNSADPDRNGGKAEPARDTARRGRNEQFASRRRTFRSAVGIDRRSSTECANTIIMTLTVNQSAVLRDDSHVISQMPEGLDIELAW
ncbi:hypothetical protein [Rhizobium sp. SL86]|uniref:hypothetical protein n=1 Tax=Rhizobium sp. SL86 TaxID=2995148 RepID=UPI002273F6A8|nr:hypothetical protein [Rhizobium sp. SL86]MCY1668188.1 hypothetical protein [Rhizobium sp. SL86]